MVWIVILVSLLLLSLLLSVIIIYNILIKARNRVLQAESDVDVQLKRRWNLIPNLVKTVKGYAKHEIETLNTVVNTRNAAMQAPPHTTQAHQAENMLTGALKNLFALAENYPELKASNNFLDLQQQLVDTENKIQAARRLYNATLRNYIDKIQVFPHNFIALIFGFQKQHQFFEIREETIREAASVSL